MAITPAQRTLRAALRACTTIEEVRRIAATLPEGTADTTWMHFAIATPLFDDDLIDRLYRLSSETLVAMARNKGLTTEQRDALHLRVARDYVEGRCPDAFRVFGPATRTGRLLAASPAGELLLNAARESPSVALHGVAYWLADIRDTTDALRGEFAARCAVEGRLAFDSWGTIATRLIGHADVPYDARSDFNPLSGIAPGAYQARFLAARAVSPLAAGWLLLDTPTPEQLATLTVDDIAPCFEVPDARVRQLALLASRGVQPAGVARPSFQPPKPPARRRRP